MTNQRDTVYFKSEIFNNETNLHMKINIRTNELLRPSGRCIVSTVNGRQLHQPTQPSLVQLYVLTYLLKGGPIQMEKLTRCYCSNWIKPDQHMLKTRKDCSRSCINANMTLANVSSRWVQNILLPSLLACELKLLLMLATLSLASS